MDKVTFVVIFLISCCFSKSSAECCVKEIFKELFYTARVTFDKWVMNRSFEEKETGFFHNFPMVKEQIMTSGSVQVFLVGLVTVCSTLVLIRHLSKNTTFHLLNTLLIENKRQLMQYLSNPSESSPDENDEHSSKDEEHSDMDPFGSNIEDEAGTLFIEDNLREKEETIQRKPSPPNPWQSKIDLFSIYYD